MTFKTKKSRSKNTTNVNSVRTQSPINTDDRKLTFLPTKKSNKMCAVAEAASFGPVAK